MNRRQWIIIGTATAVSVYILWPLPEGVYGNAREPSIAITDRKGAVLYELRRDAGAVAPMQYSDIPKQVIDALVASEDRTFYTHMGVSIRGTMRAFFQNVMALRVVSGGSTISQQLVRNLVHPAKRDLPYKVYEALMAIKIERTVSKQHILELYLNTAYFGHQSYGLQAASQTFFAKDPRQLSLAETALLVGLLQSPSAYDPLVDPSKAERRKVAVLNAMVETKIITDDQANDAKEEPLTFSHGKATILAPHFVLDLIESHPELTTTTGKEVRTTLDLELQKQVEDIVRRQIAKLADRNVTSAAVVVLDVHTGDILAMVGSADYYDVKHAGAVNVTRASRQPGSALKPFTYALALEVGMTAATTVADVETQFFTKEGNPYVPRNYDYGEHGLVRLREALANSYNIAAVRVLEKVGVQHLLAFLQSAGLTTLDREPDYYGLALTLGDSEVRLLELAQAYGMLARGGVTLHSRELLDSPTKEGKRILNPKIAWLITDILQDNRARLPEFGDKGPLTFDFPVAAKTGTTRNSRDNWALGFTPDKVVGVWVGNADNTPMRETSGVTGAGPIFHEVMLVATKGSDRKSFQQPHGLVKRDICALSGKLKSSLCPHTLQEWFIEGTEPTEADDMYRVIAIDERNGQLAQESCPASVIRHQNYVIFPPELARWAAEKGYMAPPTTFSRLCGSDYPNYSDTSWISITRPSPNASYRIDNLIPKTHQRIVFEANASNDIQRVEWSVNGKTVGTGIRPHFRVEIPMLKGEYRAEARARTVFNVVTFSVDSDIAN